jgi:hypothetical protein
VSKIIYSHVPISTLPCLLKVIEAAEAIFLYDPNTLGREVAAGLRGFGPTCATSELSGEPAYHYMGSDCFLCLTRDQIARLTSHRLTSDEYIQLRVSHGIFFEISGAFYDDEGNALMPRSLSNLA